MHVTSIGGGPAGLFFAVLARQAFPDSRIRVLERNRLGDTFGWGVVFSKETLSNIAAADPKTYAAIERSFVYWDDIEAHFRGTVRTSTGHGFCGLSRKRLLAILAERCVELGVELRFVHEVTDPETVRDADLVLGADGVNSMVRQRYADTFRPSIHQAPARFTWLGTTLPLRAFTFVFRENEHGLFRVHAYPFESGLSTWIVECTDATWRRAGLDRADDAATVAYCERLFEPDLRGHRLLPNRSVWRSFPTIRCETWSHGNVVLMGDAVHTAHFSIGSGTKLAMEDAIGLVAALKDRGAGDVEGALALYEERRRPDTERLQRSAQVSREWFEECERWMGQDPDTFQFNLMTRSHRITWDNLAARDPATVAAAGRAFARAAGDASDAPPPPAFVPWTCRGVTLRNRLVVSPMCQYSATDGVPDDWHLVHLGARATGGAGLVIAEATAVTPDGRITPGCTGIWNDAQQAAWTRIVAFVHEHSASAIGLQIGHAGRKASCSRPWDGDRPLSPEEGAWPVIGPSPDAYKDGFPTPREMTQADIAAMRDAMVAAARRAAAAGFDVLELHMAHGYLLASFLSPLSNRRTDAWGGSPANRLRFPLETIRAVRAEWPAQRPLFVRISGTDWAEGGVTVEETVAAARAMREAGADVIDVSSGGTVPHGRPSTGRMYNVPMADRIRNDAGVAVCVVGGLFDADHANAVLAAGRADLVALARPFLADAALPAREAARYGASAGQPWPRQYAAGRPAAPKKR